MTDETMARTETEIDVMSLLSTIWRGKWTIVLLTALSVTAGAFYAFRVAEPEYTATSVVALVDGEQSIVDFESVMPGLSSDRSTLNTEIEVIRSRGLIRRMIEDLDLTSDPAFNPYGRQREPGLRDLVGAYVPRLAPPPPVEPTADRVMNATIDSVLARVSVQNLRDSRVFAITAVSGDPVQAARIANALAEFYIRDQIIAKLEATEQATEWLTGRLGEMREEFEEAQRDLQDFTSTREIVTPEVLAGLNRQLNDLRERLADAETRVAETTGPALIRARAEVDALRQAVAETEVRVGAASDNLAEYTRLEREFEQYRTMFEYFQIRLRETAVQQGIQQADARLLSEAVVPLSPTSPRKPLILAVALVLGGIAGVGITLGRELRHTGFRTLSELESGTGKVAIGLLPSVRTKGREKLLAYLQERPTSRLAEAFRNLRTSILRSNLDRNVQVIMTTSSLPGEAKTMTSLCLAQSFAQMGRSVLVIECDLRRRTLANEIGFSGEFGLISVLGEEATLEDAIETRPDLMPGVDVLVADKARLNPVDVFSARKFRDFMAQMRERYDIVLLDTPPVLAVPEARVIGAEADIVVYNVRWNDTPRSVLREGLRQLEMANVQVAGLVMTRADIKMMDKYGDGYYSRYGDGYYDS